MATHDQFTQALKTARLAEAAHVDALLNVKEARGLRLAALRECLLPKLAGHPMAEGFAELTLQPGETPRLWIDLISSVVVEPDTRSFRLEQERDGRRDLLHETTDLDEMSGVVLKYIAHRVIAREKLAATATASGKGDSRQVYNLGEMVYVWFTGAALGALALLAVAILLGILKF
ncbi:MAG: hypothetical protein GYA66_01350 [Phyllobacteriaceae bacterium]|nr:hypothetical protein [Phyllobacteriaceae bacterium]